MDILLTNTIWLCRYEVYLSHVHERNLLRERERRPEKNQGLRGGRKGREDEGKQVGDE